MINVTTQTKNAYFSNSVGKHLIVSFPDINLILTDEDIVSESLSFSQTIEDNSVLSFKGCNADSLEIEFLDFEQDVRGERIVVTIQAGDTEYITIFDGIVDEQNNQNHEDVTVRIVAYDKLYTVGETDVTEWYANLVFPLTVNQFRDSFFSYIGITQETTTLPCDNLSMTRMTSADVQLTARYVMQCICQANARFGLLRGNVFTYIKLSTTVTTELLESQFINVDYDPYLMETITKVSVLDDSGATEESYGSGDNVLKIEGNMVAYAVDRAQCAEIIYGEVSGLTMNSARLELIGLPFMECGDYIELSTAKNDIGMFILSRTLKGIQGLFDSYDSTVDQYMHDIESLASELLKQNGRINHFYRDLEETKSTVAYNKADADGKFLQQQTQITQNANSISAEVTRAQGEELRLSNTITASVDALTVQIEEIYGELDGEIAVYYREGAPTLLNYPAWDFTYNIPCDGTVRTTDDLKFIYTDEYYQENIRDLVYDTDSNLTYRFEKENGAFYWKEIADTDFSVAMQRISQLEVTTEQISAEVSEVTTELHSGYYTKAQTESRLTVKSDEILASVAQNYTNSSDLANNYTSKTTFQQTANSLSASIQEETTARVNGDSATLSSARSEITASANQIKAQVQSSDTVWNTVWNGVSVNVGGVFYASSALTEPPTFNLNTYYLNQQTGTLWYRNSNNKYSRQCSALYNSASSSFTIQKDQISAKVSTDRLSTEIKAIPGGLTLDTGELMINSNYFHLYSNGTGNLGGLTFDANGFYSSANGSKVLRVYPNPTSGFALSVGDDTVSRMFYEETEQGYDITYTDDQCAFSVGHDSETYVTKLNVKNEYTKSGNNYTLSERGQLHVDDFISCWGNIEIGTEAGVVDSRIPGGSLYVRHRYSDYSGESGNVIAENYIGCFATHGGSGDIEAGHNLIYGNSCYKSSDERLKKDIKDLENSEEFIYNLRPVSYRLIDDDKEVHRGFIAQEVKPLVEEDSAIVGENPRTNYLNLAYTEIIADLVKTVQMQNERIKALERSA